VLQYHRETHLCGEEVLEDLGGALPRQVARRILHRLHPICLISRSCNALGSHRRLAREASGQALVASTHVLLAHGRRRLAEKRASIQMYNLWSALNA
jgi:hypothetical protein